MNTQDELPGFLLDALDKPLVGPIALIILGLAVILFLAWLWDKYTARELDRHRAQAAEDARLAEIDATPLGDQPARQVAWQMWADEPGEVRK